MSVNPVSNQHNAYHTNAARTEEPASQQELAPRISAVSKGGSDTFERQQYIYDPNANSYNSNAFNESLAKFRAERAAAEPVEKKETYIIQYEKPAPEKYVAEGIPMPGWTNFDGREPVTNSEKLEVKLLELRGQIMTPELEAKFEELVRLQTVEVLKERGIKVNTGDTPEERQNYEDRLNAALNGTANAVASEPPIYKSSDEVIKEFTADAVDFLTDAVEKISNGDEGLSLSSLGINRNDLAKLLVETFSSYEHASTDVTSLMKQSEDLIREFAAQIANGGEPDFNSLVTELTINGENTTIGKLMNG